MSLWLLCNWCFYCFLQKNNSKLKKILNLPCINFTQYDTLTSYEISAKLNFELLQVHLFRWNQCFSIKQILLKYIFNHFSVQISNLWITETAFLDYFVPNKYKTYLKTFCKLTPQEIWRHFFLTSTKDFEVKIFFSQTNKSGTYTIFRAYSEGFSKHCIIESFFFNW